MSRFPPSSLAVALACTLAAGSALPQRVVAPEKKFDKDEGSGIDFWFVTPYDARRQLIVHKDQLKDGKNRKIAALCVRRNGEDSVPPIPGRLFVEVWLSNTNVSPEDMSPSFAANRGPDHKRVFSQWITFPAGQAEPPSDQRWKTPYAVELDLGSSFTYANQGLLIETVTRVDPAQVPWWPIDAEFGKSAGEIDLKGTSCIPDMPGTPAGGVEDTFALGATGHFFFRGARREGIGLCVLGAREVDIDLKSMGARGCRIRTQMAWSQPFQLIGRPLGTNFGDAYLSLQIPNDKGIKDSYVFAQWFLIDLTANALGITMSNNVKAKIKEPGSRERKMRYIECTDLDATFGNVFVGRSPICKFHFTR